MTERRKIRPGSLLLVILAVLGIMILIRNMSGAGTIAYSDMCRYFREAVLPNDPVLEASLAAEGPAPETRPCPVCGRAFLPDGRTRYCSPGCARAALRQQKRNYMRKKRS